MKRIILSIILLMAFANAAHAAEILDDWVEDKGRFRIRIEKCGTEFCGFLVDFVTKSGTKTQEEKQRLGKEMLRFHATEQDGKWEGEMLRLKEGQRFDSKLRLVGDEQLKIEVCVMILCRDINFVRK